MSRKGIILAGGSRTCLHSSTISISKQLMPVYYKPMTYYPLTILIEASIDEIFIITTPNDSEVFRELLSDGKQWGTLIGYAVQPSLNGLAQAIIIGEDFLGGDDCTLILGDNPFFGENFTRTTRRATELTEDATVFGYHVKDPIAFGVDGFDGNMNAISLEGKLENSACNYAVTDLYFRDSNVSKFAKKVVPSDRGELEITTLNEIHLNERAFQVELLINEITWLDSGTHRSLLQDAQFVSVIERRQGKRICCPEHASCEDGWPTVNELKELAEF